MSSAERLWVRPAVAADVPRLVELFGERFGVPLAPAAWTWKYEQLPGAAASVVAESPAGEILAHAGAIGLPVRWGDDAGKIWQLVDFMAVTRGRGLRSAMVAAGQALLADLPPSGDVPWVFGFPSERHFRLGEHAFDYRPLAAIPLLEGPLPLVSSPSVELESGDQCGPWVAEIFESCAVPAVRRSAAFLNWRYHARPDRYYRFYRVRGRRQAALAVFAFDGELAKAAELWLPPGEDWLPGLRAIAEDLHDMGMQRWRFWPPPSSGASNLLTELGLRPSGASQLMGCRGRLGDPDPRVVAADFHYVMGDYDAT